MITDGITEIYQESYGDDVYANTPVNYVRSVTSGEVLVPRAPWKEAAVNARSSPMWNGLYGTDLDPPLE